MPPPTPIARFLAHRREELGLTLEQVGELIGKSKQSVWQRESGAAKVKLAEVEAWSKALRVPKETIARLIKNDGGNRIPVINRTSAGHVVDSLEWGTTSAEGFMYVDRDVQTEDGGLIGIEVNGSSMAPTLLDGDLVIVRSVPPDSETMPAPNCVVYIRLSAESKTPGGMLCRWIPQRDGSYLLQKDNPAYPAIVVAREHVEQFGVVIQRRTPFKS